MEIVKKVAVAVGGGAAGGMGGLEVVREFLAACKVRAPGPKRARPEICILLYIFYYFIFI